jgi:dihydroxyacid dehydratase/phosphogluconate dehydratase
VIIKTDFENFWQGFGIFCTGASAGVYTRNSISANSNAGVASRGTCSALFQASIYLSIYRYMYLYHAGVATRHAGVATRHVLGALAGQQVV